MDNNLENTNSNEDLNINDETLNQLIDKKLEKFKAEDRTPAVESKGYFEAPNVIISKSDLNTEFKSFLNTKAMTTSSDPVLVPPQYSEKIVEAFGNYGIARKNAFVQNLNSNTFYIPRVSTSANPTAYYLSEGSSSADTKVDTQTVTLTMKALQSEVRISKEMLQTAGYDVLGLVQRTVARQFAIAEDTASFMGNNNPFTGLFFDSGIQTYTQTAAGSITGLTYKDIVGVEAKLDPQFRANAKWVFDASTFAVVKGLTTTTNQPIFNETFNTILGYPYELISSGVLNSTSVTSSGTKYFALADMKESIWIADNTNFEILVDNLTLASTRQVKYLFTLFSAIGIANPNAAVVYKIQ